MLQDIMGMRYRMLKKQGHFPLVVMLQLEWKRQYLSDFKDLVNKSDAHFFINVESDDLPMTQDKWLYTNRYGSSIANEWYDARAKDVIDEVIGDSASPTKCESLKMTPRKRKFGIGLEFSAGSRGGTSVKDVSTDVYFLPVLRKGYSEKNISFVDKQLEMLYNELIVKIKHVEGKLIEKLGGTL